MPSQCGSCCQCSNAMETHFNSWKTSKKYNREILFSFIKREIVDRLMVFMWTFTLCVKIPHIAVAQLTRFTRLRKYAVSTEAFEEYPKNRVKFALYSPIILRKIHRDSSSYFDNRKITITKEKLLNVYSREKSRLSQFPLCL